LNYDGLGLRPFFSGALVRVQNRFQTVADPRRHPWAGLGSLFNSIGTVKDKWLVLRLRRQANRMDFSDACSPSTRTIKHVLEDLGFSRDITTRFFRPFFGGVFSDPHLETPQSIFEFVFSMFGKGLTTVPSLGMGAIPHQLASSLPPESIRTQSPVRSVTHSEVVLESGETIKCRAVVIATEPHVAARLTNREIPSPRHRTFCLYFSAKEPPVTGPYLILNGDGHGPINHLTVITQIAPSYAPQDQSLISVTVLHDEGARESIEHRVREQLVEWFGNVAKDWEHLKTYGIERSIPTIMPPSHPLLTVPQSATKLFLCGDYFHSPTQHGALHSGRQTAGLVLKHLQ